MGVIGLGSLALFPAAWSGCTSCALRATSLWAARSVWRTRPVTSGSPHPWDRCPLATLRTSGESCGLRGGGRKSTLPNSWSQMGFGGRGQWVREGTTTLTLSPVSESCCVEESKPRLCSIQWIHLIDSLLENLQSLVKSKTTFFPHFSWQNSCYHALLNWHLISGSRVRSDNGFNMGYLKFKKPFFICKMWRVTFVHWASQLALVVKNMPVNAGDVKDWASTLGSGRSPGGGHGNPFQ